jgi:uroporphyrin-III C-methyltransferase
VTGRVVLIGAGPGDPELVTVRAARALRRCDVVLLDDLVDRGVLRYCRPGVRVIAVGKRSGRRSTSQRAIDALLVRLARRGCIVGRVKGGDPFVFGRGGEEWERLRAAGVTVDVVSGMTAGIAVPAALGIPVTHRGLARGVTLVTGRTCDGDDVDWAALVRGGTTLVVYMGMRRLAAIVAALCAAGMPATTPAAVVQSGTRRDERRVVTTLDDLVGAVAARGLGSPAVVVVGAVVGLAEHAPARPSGAPMADIAPRDAPRTPGRTAVRCATGERSRHARRRHAASARRRTVAPPFAFVTREGRTR